MEKYPHFFQAFMLLILCVKIAFILCAVMVFYTKRNAEPVKTEFWSKWKQYLHTVFSTLMSLLLVLLFSNILNKGTVCIDGHMKIYLSTFGILSFFDFLHEYK
jgi:hypothetical protein